MENSSEIVEIGRGAELIPLEYWHQYVVKFDLNNQSKPFIVSEIGRDNELYKTNVNLEELLSGEYEDLLNKSNSSSKVDAFAKNPEQCLKSWETIIESKAKFGGTWISKEEIEVLDYNSNHGNWISSMDIPGKLKFLVNLNSTEIKNCMLQIPVEYTSGGPGYYSIYYGRFELTLDKILIWQNDVFPTSITYVWQEESLELEVFGRKIQFEKN